LKLVEMKNEKPMDCMPMALCSSPYPYGLRLTLNQEQLEALGYSELPPAGTKCRIEALGVVVKASSEDPDADGDCDYLCVELQITEMGMEEEGEGEEDESDAGDGEGTEVNGRAERMYRKNQQPA
jgi:hypothetical protein